MEIAVVHRLHRDHFNRQPHAVSQLERLLADDELLDDEELEDDELLLELEELEDELLLELDDDDKRELLCGELVEPLLTLDELDDDELLLDELDRLLEEPELDEDEPSGELLEENRQDRQDREEDGAPGDGELLCEGDEDEEGEQEEHEERKPDEEDDRLELDGHEKHEDDEEEPRLEDDKLEQEDRDDREDEDTDDREQLVEEALAELVYGGTTTGGRGGRRFLWACRCSVRRRSGLRSLCGERLLWRRFMEVAMRGSQRRREDAKMGHKKHQKPQKPTARFRVLLCSSWPFLSLSVSPSLRGLSPVHR
jgi:hypothetical protein